MTTLEEKMEEAYQVGDRVKQAELVGQTFTIHSFREEKTKDKETGGDKISIVGVISFDGSTDHTEAWMDGARIRPQLNVLAAEGALPAKVQLIRDTQQSGQPYKLLFQSNGVPAQKEAVVTQGMQTVQSKAVEAFMAARTAKSEEELTDLLYGLDIEFAYDPEGKLVVTEDSLTTKTALALKKALA